MDPDLTDTRYAAFAELASGVGELLVERTGVAAGMEVLDVACGSGNAAIAAARVGARVTGVEGRRDLLDTARERTADAMVEVTWLEADPQRLPFAPASFDRVLAVFGHAFAPDREQMAAELVRVCRPGGVLGLCAWAGPPWGETDALGALLGDRAIEAEMESIEVDGEAREYLLTIVRLA